MLYIILKLINLFLSMLIIIQYKYFQIKGSHYLCHKFIFKLAVYLFQLIT